MDGPRGAYDLIANKLRRTPVVAKIQVNGVEAFLYCQIEGAVSD